MVGGQTAEHNKSHQLTKYQLRMSVQQPPKQSLERCSSGYRT